MRRIAGSEAQESFVGSDFSYEDIGGRELEDFTYALVDENAAMDGAGRRVATRLSARLDAQGPLGLSSPASSHSS